MTEHHSSRRSKRLKKDVDRSQKLRDKHKDQGVPTTHQINRALTEGFFYHAVAQQKAGIPFKEIHVPAQRVLVYAVRILTSKTNGASQYDLVATVDAIRRRLARERSTPFRLDFLITPPRDDITDET